MGKKQKIIAGIFVVFLAFLIIGAINNITGFLIMEGSTLGYCPTMESQALEIAEERNVELVEIGSAGEVLQALENGNIDEGLVGRKAKNYEIGDATNEEILESGNTLVSRDKDVAHINDLSYLNIHTYLNEEEVEKLLKKNYNINFYESKEEVRSKIREGEVALISWDDWEDEFELIVVMSGEENKKAEDFRGVFLYN